MNIIKFHLSPNEAKDNTEANQTTDTITILSIFTMAGAGAGGPLPPRLARLAAEEKKDKKPVIPIPMNPIYDDAWKMSPFELGRHATVSMIMTLYIMGCLLTMCPAQVAAMHRKCSSNPKYIRLLTQEESIRDFIVEKARAVDFHVCNEECIYKPFQAQKHVAFRENQMVEVRRRGADRPTVSIIDRVSNSEALQSGILFVIAGALFYMGMRR